MSEVHIDQPVTAETAATTMQGVALGHPWVQVGNVVLRGEGMTRHQFAAFFVHIGKTMLSTEPQGVPTITQIAGAVEEARLARARSVGDDGWDVA